MFKWPFEPDWAPRKRNASAVGCIQSQRLHAEDPLGYHPLAL
jgi:hypothetical protein